MDTANSLHALANTASIIKGLVLEYLTHNNQGRRQKNFQEGAIGKKRAIAHQESPPLLAVADKGTH